MTTRWRSSAWPRAAVFDCDGLLVDSAQAWSDAYDLVARAVGRSLGDIDLGALRGASVAGATAQLRRDLDHPLDEADLRRALRATFVADPPPLLPGVRPVVDALAARLPLAVATNAPRRIVRDLLDHLGLGEAFRALVSAEETRRDKPAPDVYLEACRRLDVDPSDAIAFEDSPLGVEAARNAGLMVIGVPSAPRLHLGADLVVRRLDDPRLLDLLGLRLEGQARRA